MGQDSVEIWDIENGKRVKRGQGENCFLCLIRGPAGSCLDAVTDERDMAVVDLRSKRGIACFPNRYYGVLSVPDARFWVGFSEDYVGLFYLEAYRATEITINAWCNYAYAIDPPGKLRKEFSAF